MAGVARPSLVGPELSLTLNSSSLRAHNGVVDVSNSISGLLDGNDQAVGTYGTALLTTTYSNYIDFTISKKFRIWCKGNINYTDGGGVSGKKIIIQKYNGSGWDKIGERDTYNNGVWYDLTGVLADGRYKITPAANYVSMDEWYIENGERNSVLLSSQSGEAYSLKGSDPNVNIIPTMTTDTTPSGVVSGSFYYSSFQFYKAFDNDLSSASGWYANSNRPTDGHWIQYKFDSPKTINKIKLTSFLVRSGQYGIKQFIFQGSNDGIAYNNLTSSDSHPNSNSTVEYKFTNEREYLFYKLIIVSSYAGAGEAGIVALEMFESIRGILYHLPDSSENMFIAHGVREIPPFSVLIRDEVSMKNVSSTLGVGKLYEHTIDLGKKKVKEIKLN